MKMPVFLALALGLMASNAVAGVVEFRGGFCLLTVTTSCASASWNVGDCLLLRYSPPNLGTNGPTTEVSVLGQSFGDSYSLASGSLVGTTYKTVAGVHVGRQGYGFTSNMRITSQSSVSATSKSVTLAGNIQNFDDATGCDVGFQASATNRP